MIYLTAYQTDTIRYDYTFFALTMASSAGYEPVWLAKIICLTEAVIDLDSNGRDDLPVARPHGSPRKLSGQDAAVPMNLRGGDASSPERGCGPPAAPFRFMAPLRDS